MLTNVILIKSSSAFIPDYYAIFFRENGGMKDEVFNLTLFELKKLAEQMEKVIDVQLKEAKE